MNPLESARSRVQREIFEEHLSEASFLLEQWEQGLVSPLYTLQELARGNEERLLAHVDALVLGGDVTVERVLKPALGESEPAQVTAAALALLATGDARTVTWVVEHLEKGEPTTRVGVRRALELSPPGSCAASLLTMLDSREPEALAAALEVLAFWGVAPGSRLNGLLAHPVPEVRASALKVAWSSAQPVAPNLLREALLDSDPVVRDAALFAALMLGSDSAWALCRQFATENSSGSPLAMMLLAMGGEEVDLQRLLRSLAVAGPSEDVLWALGFSGRVAAAEKCLEQLEHPELGRVAAEAFCAITGLRLEGHYLAKAPETEAQDDSEDLIPFGAAYDLPVADAAAVRVWWKEHHGRFDPSTRYLLGQPLTVAWFLEVFDAAPMRRRHVMAQELALRSRGAAIVRTRAFCRAQAAQMNAVAQSVSARSFSRTLRELQSVPLARGAERTRSIAMERPRPRSSIVVTGIGMISAVGDGVVTGCAASRAGLRRISSLEDVRLWDEDTKEMEPVRAHSIPWVTEGFSGMGRLVSLSTEAFLDLHRETGLTSWDGLGLYLALPHDFYRRQMAERGLMRALHEERREEYQRRFLPTLLGTVGMAGRPRFQQLLFGEVGFVQGLQLAMKELEMGRLERCIVGGVDSLVETETLEALHALGLLKGPSNPVGFLPGEAAAFVLLERRDSAVRRDARISALIEAPSLEAESSHRLSDTHPQGLALSNCIQKTMEGLHDQGRRTGHMVGLLNGDPFRAADWGHALVRLRAAGYLSEVSEWYPALSVGECGAASGPVSVCLVTRGFARGYVGSEDVLVWMAGDDGGRGTFYMRAP